jgi:hypothetical protein
VRDMVLAGHVGKALRTIFSGQNLVTHACTFSFDSRRFPTSLEMSLDGIVSFRGAGAGGCKSATLTKT